LDGNLNERRKTMTQSKSLTLYGYVGGDPEVRTLEARTEIRRGYDPIIDDEVEREYTRPEREVRTFSIAVKGKSDDGEEVTRWIRCVDWKEASKLVRKGDRVRVDGWFQYRSYEKDGEEKQIRELIVEDLRIEKRKIREEAE
jgi:single-stranded DNA-binding protein